MGIHINDRIYNNVCSLANRHIPRNHKFYIFDKINNIVETFQYKNEMETFIKLEQDNLIDFCYGKILYFNYSDLINIIYFNESTKQISQATVMGLNDLLPFLKKEGIDIIKIEFVENVKKYEK